MPALHTSVPHTRWGHSAITGLMTDYGFPTVSCINCGSFRERRPEGSSVHYVDKQMSRYDLCWEQLRSNTMHEH